MGCTWRHHRFHGATQGHLRGGVHPEPGPRVPRGILTRPPPVSSKSLLPFPAGCPWLGPWALTAQCDLLAFYWPAGAPVSGRPWAQRWASLQLLLQTIYFSRIVAFSSQSSLAGVRGGNRGTGSFLAPARSWHSPRRGSHSLKSGPGLRAADPRHVSRSVPSRPLPGTAAILGRPEMVGGGRGRCPSEAAYSRPPPSPAAEGPRGLPSRPPQAGAQVRRCRQPVRLTPPEPRPCVH